VTFRPPWALAFLPLLLGGCTSFTQTIPVAAIPDQPDKERRFQVWTKGESYELHALRMTPDTLAGVRFWHSPTCDSCRVAIARAEVDSVRTRAYDGGETGILAIVLTPVILTMALFAAFYGSSGGY
jgi:hypothetical protein